MNEMGNPRQAVNEKKKSTAAALFQLVALDKKGTKISAGNPQGRNLVRRGPASRVYPKTRVRGLPGPVRPRWRGSG